MQIVIGILLTFVILMLLSVILVFFMFAFDTFLDLPYVATTKDKVPTIINLAQIRKGETVVDLGSGDGRLLLASAQKGALAVGYEINPFLIVLTLIRANLKGLSKQIEIRRQNLWRADLKVADVIFVYGRKKTMQKFQDFVYKNARKGTRILVNTNPFPGRKPIKSENGVFLYKI